MIEVQTFPTLEGAASAMDERSVYLAGGTLVMRDVNYGGNGWQRIVRSTDPDLGVIRMEGDRLTIGAGVTFRQLMEAQETRFLAPIARSVGGPAVRNMATVGGNLYARHPYGDLATALLALNAEIVTTAGDFDVEALLAGRDRPQGLVRAVRLAAPAREALRYLKVSRTKPKGVSVLSIAAILPDHSGRVAGARIAFGAMGPSPLRAKGAERALEGATLNAEGIKPALAALEQDLQPEDDALASAWYRRQVAPVHLRRLLLGEGRV